MLDRFFGLSLAHHRCRFGPILHANCSDLRSHHLQDHSVGGGRRGATVNNACPRCGWFAGSIGEWPRWEGKLPEGTAASAAATAAAAAASGQAPSLIGYGTVPLKDRAWWAACRARDRLEVRDGEGT